MGDIIMGSRLRQSEISKPVERRRSRRKQSRQKVILIIVLLCVVISLCTIILVRRFGQGATIISESYTHEVYRPSNKEADTEVDKFINDLNEPEDGGVRIIDDSQEKQEESLEDTNVAADNS